MDNQSLPDSASPTPSISASSVASSKQPTYTTAGTIYKPNSSQPLQPPTRRGRSLKWPIGSSLHADLAALPKAGLSGLKASAGNPYSALQQYTPLQQNYDRAIGPSTDQDHILAKMSADIPRIHISNLLNLQSFGISEIRNMEKVMKNEEEVFSGNYSDGEDEANDDDDDDDDDDDSNNNALKNLPVQSLKHLASYSNPTQKAAQKAFQRGSRARPCTLSSSMGSTTSTSSPGPASLRTSDATIEVGQGISGTKNLSQTELCALKRAQHDVISKIDGAWSTRNSTPAPAFSMPPRAKSASSEVSKAPNKRVCERRSVPMPLTAGPPGQRVFRPLTIEKALKALDVRSSPVIFNEEEDGASMMTTQIMRQRGIEDFCVVSESLDSMPTESTLSPGFKRLGHPMQMQGVQLPSGIIEPEEESYNTFQQLPDLIGSMKAWEERPHRHTSWRDQSPEVCVSYHPGTDRLTNEALKAHNKKLEEWWYSGVNKAYRRADTTNLRHVGSLRDHGLGAIGDNRPTALVSRLDTIDMEEAAIIPTSEYTRSLMEMVINAHSSDKGEHFPPRRSTPAFIH
ncbi:hypothetical protein EsDP_00000495 [Epichloe bromicola]|uniref:Uncharacterized protein n=1 Tax=Epichloe bromicola TaxID=79588 RepID=A0ABQ0CF31_9HYPO